MTGIPAVDVFVIAGTIAGGLGLLGVIGKAVRWMFQTIRRVQNFLDDWLGEEARPGVEARPGFPARLAALEVEVAAVKRIVEERLNGGRE